MLIVPLRSEGVRKAIPLMVILLILVNALVFSLQQNDAVKELAAEEFYKQSVLYRLEPEAYHRWLQTNVPTHRFRDEVRRLATQPLTDANRERLAGALQFDGVFLNELEAGRFIPVDTETRQQWRDARTRFVALQRRSLTHSGAFVPREHRPHTWFTSMFLHGDAMHLIGNMVFLWLAGALLEALIGFGRFGVVYLVTGLVSCGLSWALSPQSAIPELGASGAISGVMGALATTYGARMIPCLFNVGLYAWRGRMQGYWLAVVWIGWEAVQWAFMASNVNRAAHIGGLVAGALLGLWLARRKEVDQQTDHTSTELLHQLRERARRQATELKFESAANTMLSVVRRTQQPDDWELLWAYTRHVLKTSTGQEITQFIMSARPQQPDARDAVMAMQAQVRSQARK